MKICRNLFHLITPLACFAIAAAQADLAPGRILSLNLDPQSVTTLQLRPGFVTSVRLPEAVSSVVLGDPGAFKAEHSEAEPQLVFFKPSTPSASRTNALITTRTGREVSLALISRGAAERSAPVDYVLQYERPRSLLIEASHPSFVIGETKSLDSSKLPNTDALEQNAGNPEENLLRTQQNAVPHWEGRQLRVSVGRSSKNGDEVSMAFAVLNASPKTIELLPPQIQLTDTMKDHHKAIKAEPVAIKSYRLTSRRLAPGERADGVVTFERPAFKASSERLMLQVAHVEQVDRPVLVAVSFVPAAKGDAR
ncbi:MAG TPA: hypothetical protein VHQ22_03680 [Terriglobales bacterium]|jgi:hypothetical protein|nr:hypothetical protein [Terriglobales bacterium]